MMSAVFLGESSLRSYLEDYYAAFPSGYLLRLGLDDFKEINEKFGIRNTAYGLKKDRTVYFFLYQTRSDALPVVADEFVIVDFMGWYCR